MKTIFLILILICSGSLLAQDTLTKKEERCASIYQFKVLDIQGNEFDFACLEGKKILIVNTASKCMYGPQLHDLQKLYNKYKDQNFVVIAFPSNSFANREPKGNREIALKYKKKYGIEFPVMSKITARGDSINIVYDYLTNKVQNGVNNEPTQWNFQKYLIDTKGFLYKTIEPKTKPFDNQIIDWIEKAE